MNISIEQTRIPGVLIITPQVFTDQRGFFLEVFREDIFAAQGLPARYCQLNHSASVRNVVRGLHFQWEPAMGKLMRVIAGAAFLVAVDIRHGSPTLGQYFATEVTAESHTLIWAPAGFARGFAVLSESAEIEYLCTGVYNAKGEGGIRWNDPEIGVHWPVSQPILAPKDETAQTLAQWLARSESRAFTFGS